MVCACVGGGGGEGGGGKSLSRFPSAERCESPLLYEQNASSLDETCNHTAKIHRLKKRFLPAVCRKESTFYARLIL